MQGPRHRSVVLGVTVSLALVASLAAPSATGSLAAQDDAEITVDALTTGFWKGGAWASGTGRGAIAGMDTDMNAMIAGNFEFVALEDREGPGSVAGSWGHQGVGGLGFSGTVQGHPVSGCGVLAFSGTDGSMSGDTRIIELRGDTHTTGTLYSEAAGSTISTPIDNVAAMPVLTVRVLGGTCESVHGDWVYSIESEISQQGLGASFDGHWTAWRDPDISIEPTVDGLREAFDAAEAGEEFDLAFSGSPLFDAAMDVLMGFNGFIQRYPDWTLDEVLELARDAEWALEGMRATSDCDRLFLGEEYIERFETQLTRAIQSLIDYGLGLDDVPVEAWYILTNLAIRTGAIGSGSASPELAAHAEALLHDYAEAELNRQLDDSGQIVVSSETETLVGMSAMLGWDLTIDGTTTSAVELWADLQGSQ